MTTTLRGLLEEAEYFIDVVAEFQDGEAINKCQRENAGNLRKRIREFGDDETPQPGMSVRDFFAAAALPAVLTGQLKMAEIKALQGDLSRSILDGAEWAAATAFEIADAMIAHRGKGGAS